MQLFYAPGLQGDFHILEAQESRHIIRVLRMKAGDRIHLTDGTGKLFTGELVNDDPNHCEVRIIEVCEGYGKRNYHIHVAIAPTKNINRFEWFLEKATEIGIDEITPMVCQRSERKTVNTDRLNKVITAAMKQSGGIYHPKLNDARTFREISGSSYEGQKFIAYVEDGEHPALQSLYSAGKDVAILIGPEGDFSQEEVSYARSHDYQVVSLGNTRLRTETAGVVATHTVAMINNR